VYGLRSSSVHCAVQSWPAGVGSFVEDAVAAEDEADVEEEWEEASVVLASEVAVGAIFSEAESVASKRASVARDVAIRRGRTDRKRILNVGYS
jgi:hypothetical protein